MIWCQHIILFIFINLANSMTFPYFLVGTIKCHTFRYLEKYNSEFHTFQCSPYRMDILILCWQCCNLSLTSAQSNSPHHPMVNAILQRNSRDTNQISRAPPGINQAPERGINQIQDAPYGMDSPSTILGQDFN